MSRLTALLVVLLSASSFAQADGGVALETPKGSDVDQLRKELEAARKEMKDLREEVRAQLANQSAAQGLSEDFVEEKRKLEIIEPDGYFRIRPELFHRMDFGRLPDPSGYSTFPRPPTSDQNPGVLARDRTVAGVNMRFRFEPTFNISEEVRIRTQIDALDNVLFGSSPDYAFSRNSLNGYAYDRNNFGIFSSSQTAPNAGLNALNDSINVKRIWGEVSTPVGILRFGRMGAQWGLGMVHNDGNCLDCDWGDTVDRIMFVSEPLAGYYVTPMFDFNLEGPASMRQQGGGQPWDLSQADDAQSFVVAIARRDMEGQARAKLESGGIVFNYGVNFTYRWQRNEAADYYGAPFTNEGGAAGLNPTNFVLRRAQLFIPDVWLKLERKNFRIELEAAAYFGDIQNRALNCADANDPGKNQALGIVQLGGVLQGEYRLLDGALQIGAEVGIASGDSSSGFGNYPRRIVKGANNTTQPGDIDGPQFSCQSTGGCLDSSINNFRFNRDYRVDMILFREILGSVTDAIYIKPSVRYRIADGFHVFGAAIYSRAMFAESTPSATLLTNGTIKADANLGIEFNLGARYETEDGFFAELKYGILFPLGGFSDPRPNAPTSIDSASAIRGTLGIRF